MIDPSLRLGFLALVLGLAASPLAAQEPQLPDLDITVESTDPVPGLGTGGALPGAPHVPDFVVQRRGRVGRFSAPSSTLPKLSPEQKLSRDITAACLESAPYHARACLRIAGRAKRKGEPAEGLRPVDLPRVGDLLVQGPWQDTIVVRRGALFRWAGGAGANALKITEVTEPMTARESDEDATKPASGAIEPPTADRPPRPGPVSGPVTDSAKTPGPVTAARPEDRPTPTPTGNRTSPGRPSPERTVSGAASRPEGQPVSGPVFIEAEIVSRRAVPRPELEMEAIIPPASGVRPPGRPVSGRVIAGSPGVVPDTTDEPVVMEEIEENAMSPPAPNVRPRGEPISGPIDDTVPPPVVTIRPRGKPVSGPLFLRPPAMPAPAVRPDSGASHDTGSPPAPADIRPSGKPVSGILTRDGTVLPIVR